MHHFVILTSLVDSARIYWTQLSVKKMKNIAKRTWDHTINSYKLKEKLEMKIIILLNKIIIINRVQFTFPSSLSIEVASFSWISGFTANS